MKKIIKDYMSKGWTAPLPLPAGDKFPPPQNTTGNLSPIKADRIAEMWEGRSENTNLGLRLQAKGNYEVISLDVDHYENKVGETHLAEMEEQLGALNRTQVPRSTRRGLKSPSAQFFFRVPKGFKWKSLACTSVDVIQMTHRYAAVYPSIVDGLQYKWYLGDEEIDIPAVNDLPILPERWVNFLRKSEVGKLVTERSVSFDVDHGDSHRDAVNWLRDNIPGWETSENMSQSLRKVSDSPEFRDSLVGNGHDTAVSAIHAAVMLGVEGHQGLKAALHKIKANFIDIVAIQEGKRTERQVTIEYEEAVVGEVNRLINEINDGSVAITEYSASLALPGFHDLLVRSEADKRPIDVDLDQYSNTDMGHAEMFRDYWSKDVLTVFGGSPSEEFAVWSPTTGLYEFRDKKRMFGFMEPAISARIIHEAGKLYSQAEDLAGIAEDRQLKEDELDPDEIKAEANKLWQRADRCRATNTRKAILEQMHGFDESSIDISRFDSAETVIGLQGGEALDLDALRGGEDFVRKGRQVDLITKTTAVRLVPEAESKAWNDFLNDFLPNPNLRRFVQKVIGYSLLAGNPDKKIIFLYGPSNTGKTTILEACARAMGDYAGPMNAMKLFGSNGGGPSPEMVESLNKRFVFMAEVGDDHHLSANAVKRVTGNDTQHNRQLHSNIMRSAAPKFTPYISTNSVPAIKGVDSATKERIMVIPFEQVHPRKRITPENDLKTPENMTAILWWIVEGLMLYFDEGMDPEEWPESVKRASGVFASDTSPMQGFLEDHIEQTGNVKDRIGLRSLFQVWENWCSKNRVDRSEIGSFDGFRKGLQGDGWDILRTTFNNKGNQWVARGVRVIEE